MYRKVIATVPRGQFDKISAVVKGGVLKEIQCSGESWFAIALENVSDEQVNKIKTSLKRLERVDLFAIPESNGLERLIKGGHIFRQSLI